MVLKGFLFDPKPDNLQTTSSQQLFDQDLEPTDHHFVDRDPPQPRVGPPRACAAHFGLL